jgi:integrase
VSIRPHTAKDGTRTYGVRINRGAGEEWVGTFRTIREAKKAEAKALESPNRSDTTVSCGDWTARFLARYQRERKDSSYDTARGALQRFLADFGDRPLDAIGRLEAIDWAESVPASRIPVVITLMNAAVDAELIDRNPFRGLQRTTRGRSDDHPPTPEELKKILVACSVHKNYATEMRALVQFAAYSGMRPGELFVLEHTNIDTENMRIDVRRRLYRGRVDLPKSNKVRRIALTPPARDALLELPHRTGLVFRTKTGKRLSQPTLSGYWGKVLAAAGLEFDFYHATKHWAVHDLYVTRELHPRVIAEQMGWELGGTLKLLKIYGHGDVGALEEIDRSFGSNVTPLRRVAS